MTNLAFTHTALDRFYENLAYKPWCGDDKSAQMVRPKANAVKKCYIAPNPPALVYWLIFDLDIDESTVFVWEDRNLPPPNIVVKNKHNDRQHLYYAISPVCITENARKKPIQYMKSITRGLGKALGADPAYTGRIAKNPMSENWRTYELHAHEYSLKELEDYAAPISEVFDPFKYSDEYECQEGRNNTLFHKLRFWAYAHVDHYRTHSSWKKWRDEVLDQALDFSTIEADFGYNEIKNTAKSVAKWTWNNYYGRSVNRGVMELKGTDISLEAKQRLAARRTHELRSNKTQELLIKEIQKALLEGLDITQTLISKRARISRQQISRRYAHLFTEEYLLSLRQEHEVIQDKGCNICSDQIAAGGLGGLFKKGYPLYIVSTVEGVEKKDEGD